MAKVIFIFIGIIIPALCFSQLNAPESIVYYPDGNYYLVSNKGNGTISKFFMDESNSTFATGLIAPKGLTIIGDTLFIADVTNLVALDIKTGNKLFTRPITGSAFLNDICSDSSKYLYLTDTQMNTIFKFELSTQEITTLQLKGNIIAPNGIIYKDGKLLGVSMMIDSPIWQVDLSTNVVTNLKTTTYDYLDGIQTDGKGNIFFSAWVNTSQNGKGIVYKINDNFSGDFTQVADGLSGPADILINNNILFIPEMNANKITIVDFNSVKEKKKIILNQNGNIIVPEDLIPPFNLEVYNLQGNLIFKEQTNISGIKLNLPSGVYFVIINGQNLGSIMIDK